MVTATAVAKISLSSPHLLTRLHLVSSGRGPTERSLMAVLLTQDIPLSREALEAVTTEMGVRLKPPDGLIVHLMTEIPEGVHVVDVWESTEQYEQFRLTPAIGKVMADRGIVAPDKLPKPVITAAHDLVRGRQLTPAGVSS
jgi:hypothetical protein